jgi:hypothetical protein
MYLMYKSRLSVIFFQQLKNIVALPSVIWITICCCLNYLFFCRLALLFCCSKIFSMFSFCKFDYEIFLKVIFFVLQCLQFNNLYVCIYVFHQIWGRILASVPQILFQPMCSSPLGLRSLDIVLPTLKCNAPTFIKLVSLFQSGKFVLI